MYPFYHPSVYIGDWSISDYLDQKQCVRHKTLVYLCTPNLRRIHQICAVFGTICRKFMDTRVLQIAGFPTIFWNHHIFQNTDAHVICNFMVH